MDIVALLLQNKAPINWATRDGSTPMHVCAAVRSSSSRQDDMRAIATLLLSNSKLDLHAVNRAGRTSVSIAHDAVIKHKMREALLVCNSAWQCLLQGRGALLREGPPVLGAAPCSCCTHITAC